MITEVKQHWARLVLGCGRLFKCCLSVVSSCGSAGWNKKHLKSAFEPSEPVHIFFYDPVVLELLFYGQQQYDCYTTTKPENVRRAVLNFMMAASYEIQRNKICFNMGKNYELLHKFLSLPKYFWLPVQIFLSPPVVLLSFLLVVLLLYDSKSTLIRLDRIKKLVESVVVHQSICSCTIASRL